MNSGSQEGKKTFSCTLFADHKRKLEVRSGPVWLQASQFCDWGFIDCAFFYWCRCCEYLPTVYLIEGTYMRGLFFFFPCQYLEYWQASEVRGLQ